MAWFGYKKQARGAANNVSKSDRVLRLRNISQKMGDSISLQTEPILMPTSRTIVQPLPENAIAAAQNKQQLKMVREEAGKINEEIQKIGAEQDLINNEKFKKASEPEKLNLLMKAINKIGTSMAVGFEGMKSVLNADEEGVFPRLWDCEAAVDDFSERIDQLGRNK